MLTNMEYGLLKRAEKNGFIDFTKLTDKEKQAARFLIAEGYLGKVPEKSNANPNDFRKMLDKHPKQKRNDWHYYRNLILFSVSAFCVGVILCAFFETFGLFAALCALALCFFSGVLITNI